MILVEVTHGQGPVSLDIQFGEAINLDGGIQLVCYAEYDNLITIDGNRNIFFDYTL